MKRHNSLRTINLNLIPVLRALLKEISVTRAAKQLALSPSATSGALAELRTLLGDPLLVRVGRNLRLTHRAEQLIGPVEQACMALEGLFTDTEFDPRTTERNFVVATPDYVSFLLSQILTAALRAEAPGVSVQFVDVPADLEKRLALGGIDLAVADINHWQWRDVVTSATFTDRLVAVVDRKHPLASMPIADRTLLAEYSCIEWYPGLDLGSRLAERGLISPVVDPVSHVSVQRLTSLPLLAVDSELVVIVPKALADHMARLLPITIIELPYDNITIVSAAIWNSVQEPDQAHHWFRDMVVTMLHQVM